MKLLALISLFPGTTARIAFTNDRAANSPIGIQIIKCPR